jgi:hypothetical protein
MIRPLLVLERAKSRWPSLALVATVPSAPVDILLDIDFEHLSPLIDDPDGLDDGDRIQDLSGNGYHGFWGATGSNMPVIATLGNGHQHQR